MALRTLDAVASETGTFPLTKLETVCIDTPALFATSIIVVRFGTTVDITTNLTSTGLALGEWDAPITADRFPSQLDDSHLRKTTVASWAGIASSAAGTHSKRGLASGSLVNGQSSGRGVCDQLCQ